MSNLKTHMISHTAKKPFKCDICDYVAAHKSTLKSHMRTRHTSNRTRSFKCDRCDFSALAKAHLTSHQRIHEIKQYHCTQCDRSNVTCVNMHHHRDKLSHHTNVFTPEKNHICVRSVIMLRPNGVICRPTSELTLAKHRITVINATIKQRTKVHWLLIRKSTQILNFLNVTNVISAVSFKEP